MFLILLSLLYFGTNIGVAKSASKIIVKYSMEEVVKNITRVKNIAGIASVECIICLILRGSLL
uniref:Uncharacterized protein n=1 Tax=Cryptosporidium parvum TaxID=5807 RepID=F0X675_CRYPV